MNSPRGRVTTTPLEASSITLSATLQIRKGLRTAIQSRSWTRRGTRRTEDQEGMLAGNAERNISSRHGFPLGRVAKILEIRFQPATKASRHASLPYRTAGRGTPCSQLQLLYVDSGATGHPLTIWMHYTIMSLSRPLALAKRQRTIILGPCCMIRAFLLAFGRKRWSP